MVYRIKLNRWKDEVEKDGTKEEDKLTGRVTHPSHILKCYYINTMFISLQEDTEESIIGNIMELTLYKCSLCGDNMESGQFRYSCNVCEYDVCESCYLKEKKGILTPDVTSRKWCERCEFWKIDFGFRAGNVECECNGMHVVMRRSGIGHPQFMNFPPAEWAGRKCPRCTRTWFWCRCNHRLPGGYLDWLTQIEHDEYRTTLRYTNQRRNFGNPPHLAYNYQYTRGGGSASWASPELQHRRNGTDATAQHSTVSAPSQSSHFVPPIGSNASGSTDTEPNIWTRGYLDKNGQYKTRNPDDSDTEDKYYPEHNKNSGHIVILNSEWTFNNHTGIATSKSTGQQLTRPQPCIDLTTPVEPGVLTDERYRQLYNPTIVTHDVFDGLDEPTEDYPMDIDPEDRGLIHDTDCTNDRNTEDRRAVQQSIGIGPPYQRKIELVNTAPQRTEEDDEYSHSNDSDAFARMHRTMSLAARLDPRRYQSTEEFYPHVKQEPEESDQDEPLPPPVQLHLTRAYGREESSNSQESEQQVKEEEESDTTGAESALVPTFAPPVGLNFHNDALQNNGNGQSPNDTRQRKRRRQRKRAPSDSSGANSTTYARLFAPPVGLNFSDNNHAHEEHDQTTRIDSGNRDREWAREQDIDEPERQHTMRHFLEERRMMPGRTPQSDDDSEANGDTQPSTPGRNAERRSRKRSRSRICRTEIEKARQRDIESAHNDPNPIIRRQSPRRDHDDSRINMVPADMYEEDDDPRTWQAERESNERNERDSPSGNALMITNDAGDALTHLATSAPGHPVIRNKTTIGENPQVDPDQVTFMEVLWQHPKIDFQIKNAGDKTSELGEVSIGIGPKTKAAGIKPGMTLLWINDLPYSKTLWTSIQKNGLITWTRPIQLTFRHREWKSNGKKAKLRARVRFRQDFLEEATKQESPQWGKREKQKDQEKGHQPNLKLIVGATDSKLQEYQNRRAQARAIKAYEEAYATRVQKPEETFFVIYQESRSTSRWTSTLRRKRRTKVPPNMTHMVH